MSTRLPRAWWSRSFSQRDLESGPTELSRRLLGFFGLRAHHHTGRDNLEAATEYEEESRAQSPSIHGHLVCILLSNVKAQT